MLSAPIAFPVQLPLPGSTLLLSIHGQLAHALLWEVCPDGFSVFFGSSQPLGHTSP